jgi:hypothetical protein
LKPPINDSDHQSDKINLTESFTFLDDFYTKKLGVYTLNSSGIGIVNLNESEWSTTKVLGNNKGLYKDLILLQELKTLNSETVDFKELSDREKLVTEIYRKIVAKIKRFLDLKEEKVSKLRKKSGSRTLENIEESNAIRG